MTKESFHLKSEHYGTRQHCTDKRKEVKKDVKNKKNVERKENGA